MEALLPIALKSLNCFGRHRRRNQFKDREAKIVWVSLPQKSVSTVSGSPVIAPSTQKIFNAEGGAYIAFTVRAIKNVVNATPFGELGLPTLRQYTELAPSEVYQSAEEPLATEWA